MCYTMLMEVNYRNIDKEKHQRLKELVARQGMSLTSWYRLQVDRYLEFPVAKDHRTVVSPTEEPSEAPFIEVAPTDPVEAMREQMKDMGIVSKDKATSNLFDAEEAPKFIQRKPPMYPTCNTYKNNPTLECLDCNGRAECEEIYG